MKKGVLVLLALVFAIVGCSKKAPECNALIGQINGSASAMEAATREFSTAKQTKQASEKFASANQAELDKLERVELTLPELAAFSKSYQGLLGSVATAALALGKSNSEREELLSMVKESQADLIRANQKLAGACDKAKKECVALGGELTAPQAFAGKPDDAAKNLDEYAKKLAAAPVKDADVKAAIGELEKAVLEFAGLLRKSASAQRQYEQALKSLSDINANEPLLIKSINDFCQGR